MDNGKEVANAEKQKITELVIIDIGDISVASQISSNGREWCLT